MPSGESRISELDSLRGIAAMGVVTFHYHAHLGGAPLFSVLEPIYLSGLLFVYFFFILSGFILAQVYAVEGRYRTIRAAIVSRIARLYPLHLFTLGIVAVLQIMHAWITQYRFIYPYNDWYHLFLNVCMLQYSGLQTGFSFNGPSWSISTEFIVNVVFLTLALASAKRALVVGCVLVLAALSLDPGVGWIHHEIIPHPCYGLLQCFLTFGVGLLVHAGHERLRKRHMPAWTADIAFLCVCAAVARLFSMPSLTYSFYVLVFLCFPALIMLSLRSRVFGSVLRLRPLVHLGQVSYSLYLLSFPLELVIEDVTAATHRSPNFDNPLVFAVYCAVCIILSHYSWKYLEMPMRRLIKRLA